MTSWTEGTGEPEEPGAATYQLAWRADGSAALTATAADAAAVLRAGLRGVLAAARLDGQPGAAEADEATAAVPIRGQGADLARVFAELAADLLAQLDANGPDFDHVRLDGLLRTDEGGFTAWGYAIGRIAQGPSADPPPVDLGLDGEPSVAVGEGGRLVLRCTLRRGEPPARAPTLLPDRAPE